MGYRRLNPAEKLVNKLFSKRSMISEEMMESKIRSFSRPTTSYFMLLTASIIIATLGLLMNASAIVIGSMIISPLTWPLFGLADGAALGNRKRIWANLAILVVSVFMSVALAYALTVLSPLKVVNSEILARSKPTLLDAVVALTAGGIGTLAIVRRNISDSVAGVAVALSLTPPLCVLGISLALGESSIVSGSFLLLVTNALSITLVAGILFILIHYSWRRKLRMAPKAFIIMAISLLLTAIPLYQLLNKYSLETSSYSIVQTQLEEFVTSKSRSSGVRNIQTSLENSEGISTLLVDADLFLPSSETITFEEKDRLVAGLEESIDRPIKLRLNIQNIALLSNRTEESEKTAKAIREVIDSYLIIEELPIIIEDYEAVKQIDAWSIDLTLKTSEKNILTPVQIASIRDNLQAQIEVEATISTTYSIVESGTAATLSLESSMLSILDNEPNISLEEIDHRDDTDELKVSIVLNSQNNSELSASSIESVKQAVINSYGQTVDTSIRYLYSQSLELLN